MFTPHMIDWQGKMLGRYRLQRLLGRGGMGEVWQASDTELERQVAIKLLPPVLRQEEEYLRAFTAEARLIAALEHPHILAVHDFGEFQFADEVITYLIMPLVGGTLRERIRQSQSILPIATTLNYLRQAAEAIDYAHSRRILHRDIKPANILLQDDWLFLADFGIAKLLSTSTYRSRTNAGAGTPGYMAPEQIRGKAEAASDLYSLAVVAYQLLTNHLPFSGSEALEIFIKHLKDEPLPPRLFNAQLPEAMERTILKSLARIPAERHASCIAFVAELEQGCSIGNSPIPFDADATHLAPWSKRAQRSSFAPTQYNENTSTRSIAPRGVSQQSMIASMLPPTTPADPTLFSKTMTTAEGREQTMAVETKTSSRNTRRVFLFGGTAAALLIAGGGVALASFLQPGSQSLQKIGAGVPLLKLTGHTEAVANIRWNPRGRYLASSGLDTKVLLWDIEALLATANGKLLTVQRPTAAYKPDNTQHSNELAWSPDGRSLAVVTSSSTWSDFSDAIAVINIFTPGARPVVYYDATLKATIVATAWSPTSNTIATGTYTTGDVAVALWKPDQTHQANATLKDTTRTAQQKQEGRGFALQALCWSQDETWLIGIDEQFFMLLWNVTTSKMQRIALPDRMMYLPASARKQPSIDRYNVVASPIDPALCALSDNDVAVVYDIKKNKFIYLLSTDDPTAHQPIDGTPPYYAQITGLAWSPDGRYLAGGYLSSKQIYIWDLQNPHPRVKNGARMPDLTFGKTNGHSDSVLDLAWSPDGRYLASSSFDSSIIIWQMDKA